MDIAELERQVEYRFAPVPLLAVQALANTFDLETAEELLGDPPTAREWLLDSDLARPDIVVSEVELERLVGFRRVVRELIEANLSGAPSGGAERTLSRLLAEHPVALIAAVGGELSLDLAPAPSVDDLISQQVGIIFRAQLLAQWPRLKICASDECRWAFYDSSRNRGGTWCQMEVCGNRIKNRRYRRRATERER